MAQLLGPNGQPIASSDYKKAPPPTLGEKYGNWSGEATNLLKLPGGGLIGFDLDSLTLEDFRQMKDHYQINSSLSILTFMMHQMEWHVESDDKKLEAQCEEQLRNVWSRLVRAKSQSFWAGYSPNVLEWENDVQGKSIVLNKVKDLYPEDCRVHWKKVDGSAIHDDPAYPNLLAPTNKIKIYDGISQRGWAGPIPVDNTYWYPLLMENGNYYGKKLLRPAFQSWFFSILLHLFANRYYERFGEPTPVGRAPFEDDIEYEGESLKGNKAMELILTQLRNRSTVILPNDKTPWGEDNNPDYDYTIEYLECVDDQTEILTKSGWKNYNKVTESDETLTLNHYTGVSEWQHIEKINTHAAKDRMMLSMEGTTHSSLTTMGHRWPVLNKHRPQKTAPGGLKEAYDSRDWVTSASLRAADRIPLIADRVDYPAEQKYEDAFVELVAWYWTEGYTYVTGNYVSLSQKRFPEKIRSALTRLFGPAVAFFPRTGRSRTDGIPRWRENGKTNDEDSRQFFLNYEIVQLLKSVCPEKIPTYDFILSLTKAQLDLYIETAMLADGNKTDRQSFLMQKSKNIAEMFQFACIQAGYATSLYWLKEDARFPEDTGMWVVSIRRNKFLHPLNAHRGNGPFEMSKKTYSGTVWCPTTKNGTWLARRNGKVYFTGNSQMRGADFEKYMTRLDEEMSLALFTPILLMRTADVGSYNLGVGHLQVYLWMLNAISADWAQYINKYILRPIARFNHQSGVNHPEVKIVFRTLGKENDELIRDVIRDGVTSGKLEVDVRQLAEQTGLTLKEIDELTLSDDELEAKEKNNEEDPGNQGAAKGSTDATTEKIAARVAPQVQNAYKVNEVPDPEKINLGFNKQMTEVFASAGVSDPAHATKVFYSYMRVWMDDAESLGLDTSEAYMRQFGLAMNNFAKELTHG